MLMRVHTRGMDDRQTGPGLLRRGWLRLLDGERPWGSFDVEPDRFGMIRYRLVVFPPGISESERRRVRVARCWPGWSALAWIICEIWVRNLTGPRIAIAISTAVCLGVALTAVAAGGKPRTQVRTMAAMIAAGHHDPLSDAARDVLRNLAGSLLDADERRAMGEISATEHEAIWWRIYDQMESGHRAAPHMRSTGRCA
jgi:hypothetical protein